MDLTIWKKLREEIEDDDFDAVDINWEDILDIRDNVVYGFSPEVNPNDYPNVVIPKGVESIGVGAFSDSNLTSITISNTVVNIDTSAFFHCVNLTDIVIPDGVKSISHAMFGYCINLKNVMIPNSVTSISSNAFQGCSSLTNITIPKSVTSIGNSAFYDCIRLTSITIPNGVTSIESTTFQDCSSLTSITIPNSVTDIGYYAFSGCSSLTSITIPDSVTSIDNGVFHNCSGLKNLTLPKNLTSFSIAGLPENLNSLVLPDCVDLNDYSLAKLKKDLSELNYSITYKNIVYDSGKALVAKISKDKKKQRQESSLSNLYRVGSTVSSLVATPNRTKPSANVSMRANINLTRSSAPVFFTSLEEADKVAKQFAAANAKSYKAKLQTADKSFAKVKTNLGDVLIQEWRIANDPDWERFVVQTGIK